MNFPKEYITDYIAQCRQAIKVLSKDTLLTNKEPSLIKKRTTKLNYSK